MSIRVQLQQFEGPLDLLLYLIRKEEMDIFNINVTEITKQYLDYIKLMKEFDIEVAGEFIAMASTLIQIKSRMLLPQYDENGEVVESEDPRKELVQKLLEYEKFKEAAKALYERPLLNRDQWARGFREKIEVADDEIELEDNALFSLIGSYRKMMKAAYKRVHKVSIKLQSIASRILEMKEKLIPGQQVTMKELFNHSLTDIKEKSRNALITFLSLLELGKMGFVSVYQTENYGDIYVNTKKPIEGDVVSRVEEYGNINAEQAAQDLIAKTNILTEEELKAIENEPSDFVLNDGGVNAQTEQLSFDQIAPDMQNITDSSLTSFIEDMASDDEILAAEMEIQASELNLDMNIVGSLEDQPQNEIVVAEMEQDRQNEQESIITLENVDTQTLVSDLGYESTLSDKTEPLLDGVLVEYSLAQEVFIEDASSEMAYQSSSEVVEEQQSVSLSENEVINEETLTFAMAQTDISTDSSEDLPQDFSKDEELI
ncbi:MAG: segregation and condensation protein A [Pseudobdellovibrio sp.]